MLVVVTIVHAGDREKALELVHTPLRTLPRCPSRQCIHLPRPLPDVARDQPYFLQQIGPAIERWSVAYARCSCVRTQMCVMDSEIILHG